MMKRRFTVLILSIVLAMGLVSGMAFAAEGGGGSGKPQLASQANIVSQVDNWGWVSVEGGPTFYGTPQKITVKGLTNSYSGYSSYNKARFIVRKGGNILYQEDVKFSKEDWYGMVPVRFGCTLTEPGSYTVEFFQIYDWGDGWGYQRKGDIYETSFTIAKAKKANPITVKAKAVSFSASKVKKGTQTATASKAFTVKKAQGKLTYKVAKYVTKAAKGKVKVAGNGKVTVKKGTKKGTYKLKVKVSAAGNATYKAGSKTVTLTVKVK